MASADRWFCLFLSLVHGVMEHLVEHHEVVEAICLPLHLS